MRGRGLLAAGVLVCAGVAAACTDGTTPDCSDAQCLPVIVVDATSLGEGGDSGRGPDGTPDVTTDSAPDGGAGRAPSDGSVDSGDSSSPDVRDAGGGD
jgi:hypothetical protein